jgi:hypothetical protein
VFVTYKHGKVIVVLNEATYQDDVIRRGVTAQHILNYGTSCTVVVSIMFQQTPLPLDTTSSTYWIGGSVGPGADLDLVCKRKFLSHVRNVFSYLVSSWPLPDCAS